MITCICVTHERPQFMAWLLHNFHKQSYENKELLIVDSSKRPFCSAEDNIRVIHAPDANIPSKRNIGLVEAKGDCIAWFDDDDWSHRERLAISAQHLQGGYDVVGPAVGYGLNLETMTVRQFSKMPHPAVVFGGVAMRRKVAIQFDNGADRGSDSAWMAYVKQHYAIKQVRSPHLIVTVSHSKNISNPVSAHDFPYDLSALRQRLGHDLTVADMQQLSRLRRRVYG